MPDLKAETGVVPSAFLSGLIAQWRAQDMHGVWNNKSDQELLAPYIFTKEKRRTLPLMADPDAQTLWRLEIFYDAIGLAIARATGVMVTPMIKIHAEGFGRVMLTAGRLVVFVKHVRDAHRFGFESLEALIADGEAQVAAGIDMIRRFPDVAAFGLKGDT
ncbi:MAG: NifX-associated nitrogen fixation protein [Gammaproteobacteria bacterium]|nr:NifX-associated nitrogen fixation protein [Gammaproteobacteria bacterium]